MSTETAPFFALNQLAQTGGAARGLSCQKAMSRQCAVAPGKGTMARADEGEEDEDEEDAQADKPETSWIPCRTRAARTLGGSCPASDLDARVQEAVDEVQEDEAEHVDEGLDGQGAHEDGHVVLLDGDEVEVADAGPAEYAFDDDVARDGAEEAQVWPGS